MFTQAAIAEPQGRSPNLKDDRRTSRTIIDHTSYERLDSPTLQDRGYHHQPSAPGKVAMGQGYSTIAWIPEEQGSWALPIRHERITSFETPISKAVWHKAIALNPNFSIY